MDLQLIATQNQKAFDHFKKWFWNKYKGKFKTETETGVPEEIIIRSMYDFFDHHRIFVSVKNKPQKGYNTFSVKVSVDNPCTGIQSEIWVSVFDKRIEAEDVGFKNAFELFELNFDKLVRTNTQPN